jgi:hypothetical protein
MVRRFWTLCKKKKKEIKWINVEYLLKMLDWLRNGWNWSKIAMISWKVRMNFPMNSYDVANVLLSLLDWNTELETLKNVKMRTSFNKNSWKKMIVCYFLIYFSTIELLCWDSDPSIDVSPCLFAKLFNRA